MGTQDENVSQRVSSVAMAVLIAMVTGGGAGAVFTNGKAAVDARSLDRITQEIGRVNRLVEETGRQCRSDVRELQAKNRELEVKVAVLNAVMARRANEYQQ